MPYLSRLILGPSHRQARLDLARPYELHRTLWRAFPEGDPGRILFRLDADRQGLHPVILVQSDWEPEWERLPADGYLAAPPEWKRFEPTFVAGHRLRFRLRANPTKKVGSSLRTERVAGRKDNGQRVALLGEAEQVAWLLDKGKHGGFRIPGEWMEDTASRKVPIFRVKVIPEGWVRCGKTGHTEGQFFSVRFEGGLEITDPLRFRETVESGIGPAKAFGFGLLSLAPLGVGP